MSRQIPYQPMRQVPVASEAEVQAMLTRLKDRTQGSGMVPRRAHNPERSGSIPAPATNSQPSEATQSGASPKSKLEWEKAQKDSTAVKTKCGHYSCCKVTTNGKLHYELWKFVPSGGWFARIDKGSGLDNFLQAQVMAQQDFEKQ